MIGERNPETLRVEYVVDKTQRYPIHFFVKGDPYEFWGLWETDVHLFGVREGTMFLYGTDRLGRDLLSRIFYGTRISTTIGLIGVTLSLFIGVLLGGLSGYFGGIWDNLLQRLIEFLKSIPKLPLWMGLSAAIPVDWPVTRVFFAITIILSLIGWTGLARVVRSKFLSLREEDFVVAARLGNVKPVRIVLKHMVPSFMSYIIARVTLALPQMILRETSLSFLGLGMQPPAVSWGVLLKDAQNIHSVALHPWLLIPGLWVIVTILVFNFVGDGLRDAADPYGR
jgi:peptide/nickel transport system permease protein